MATSRTIGAVVLGAFFLVLPDGAAAQAGAILGEIVDVSSGRAVSQAQVTLTAAGGAVGVRTTTGMLGSFVIRGVQPGRYALEVKRIGYEPLRSDSVWVVAGDTVRLALTMTPFPFRLADVTVAPGSFSFLDAGPAQRQTVSRAEIESAPFGEDLFRAMNRLPGLSSGDYGAQFSIRGGRHDETLILLDGLELYEPYHLKDFNEGAMSIIDVAAINGVELLTGGFPAHYGDKRSGVMSIASRTPTKDGTSVSAGASFANAHALGEGSFAGGRGGWLVSGRKGFFDVLLRTISKSETRAPSYEDVFGTLRYRLNRNHTLGFNVLHAGDRYRFAINGTTGFNDTIRTRESANNSYGNSYAWLTLRSLAGRHLVLRTLASAGRVNATRHGDEGTLTSPVELYGVDGQRGFSVLGLKQDFTYQRSERMVLDWGYDVRWMDAHFDWENRVRQNPDDPTPDTLGYYPRVTRRTKNTVGTTTGAYVSERLRVVGPLTLELGIRYDAASYTHERGWSPRAHALVRLWEGGALRAGWGLYRQRQGIADENAFDRLNRYFPSEESRQWTLGMEHHYADGGSLRAEWYYKDGSRLRPILRNWKGGLNAFPESSEDRILVYPLSSTSKGLELYHDRAIGNRITLRAGYALSFVEERLSRLDAVNDRFKPPVDSTPPGPQDQRHALNVDLSYRIFGNWSLTSAMTYHTGWPFTYEKGVPVQRRNGTMDLAVRPDTLYGRRLPPYQRMDVRFTRRRQTENGEMRLFVEVINMTNHENVLGYDVFRIRDASGALALERATETWFSILPSLGFSWTKRF